MIVAIKSEIEMADGMDSIHVKSHDMLHIFKISRLLLANRLDKNLTTN